MENDFAVNTVSSNESKRTKKTSSEISDDLMDILLFLAALIASLAVAPLLAFGFDDLNAANQRYLNYHNHTSGSSYSIFGKTPVSSMIAFFSSWSSSLAGMTLVALIIIRCTLALAKTYSLPDEVMDYLHRCAKPLF